MAGEIPNRGEGPEPISPEEAERKRLEELWFSSEDSDEMGHLLSLRLKTRPISKFQDFDNSFSEIAPLSRDFESIETDPVLRAQEYIRSLHKIKIDLLRDIFRNPFAKEPVKFDERWRTSDVMGLALAIYDDKAFDRMPILADALMDAGCEDEEIIGHCRSECEHVRGCWVVDLILQKG